MRRIVFSSALVGFYDDLLNEIELEILRQAKVHDANSLHLLDTVPGIGKILSLVILYEVHDIGRFPTVQDFASYGRMVKAKKESAGKVSGSSGSKIGNANLKWAFSEAAVGFLRNNPSGQAYLARLEKKHGKAKALTALAHILSRAIPQSTRRDWTFTAAPPLRQKQLALSVRALPLTRA